MRIDFRRLAATVLCLLSLTAVSVSKAAFAQSAPATQAPGGGEMPPCDGVLAVIRISEITPGGSVEKFMAAVDAQRAWYAHHGMEDLIFASRVLVHDSATNSFSYSDKMVLSYHYYSNKPVPPHDAEWDAFVKAFAETSKIKEGPLTCVPRSMVPTSAPK